MKNILIVKNLTILSLFVVIFFRLFKTDVYVYKCSIGFSKYWWLRILSLQECNFETCANIDISSLHGHEGDIVDKIVDEFIDSRTLIKFNQFFVNVKDPDDKLRLLIKEYVVSRCRELNRISAWVNGSFSNCSECHPKIYLLGDICRIRESFLLKQCHDIKLILIFPSNFYLIIDIILRIFRVFFRKFFAFFLFAKAKVVKRNDIGDITLSSIMSSNIDNSLYKVLFFPHQSVFYGDLFIKDHFYSKDKGSVFHPSNILHVEFSNIALNRKQSKFYNDNGITTVLFPKSNVKEYYKNFNYVISTIGLINTLFLLKKNLILFVVLLFNCLKFLSTRGAIKTFSDVKVVLVGYEILFPSIVSLAFESRKVRTVAIQERFIVPAFYSNFGFIVDSYFCNSEFVCDKLKKSKSKFVNICIPCGQARTDILINFQRSNTQDNDRFTIVAFDYHSVEDVSSNRHEPIANWRANNSFYKDLCRLSEQFPNINIIIRGKNINWTKNAFFKDVLMRIDNNPNIVIDTDFSEPNIQYKLSAQADFIIAKHTSIADELIAIGKMVVFYDFSPNSSKVISREYDYNKSNIFVYSYEELELMVKSVINDGQLLTEPKLIELQKIINNGPADGKVKDRIMNNLDIVYAASNKLYI